MGHFRKIFASHFDPITKQECSSYLIESTYGVTVALVFGVPMEADTPEFSKMLADTSDLFVAAPELLEAARIGKKMREAQNAYFASRKRDDLITSKAAEKAFDDALKLAFARF